MEDAIDWDAIDEDMLKEKAPDLYKKLKIVPKSSKEAKDDDEDDDEDEGDPDPDAAPAPNGLTKAVERQIESIVKRSLESVETTREQRQAVHKQIETVVNKSTLPDVTKKRVIASFNGAESFDETRVTEAIDEAKAEVAALVGPRVRGAGPSGGGAEAKVHIGRAHESLEAAFGIKKGKSKTEGKEKE